MKIRADNTTLEDKILVEANEAVQSVEKLLSSLNGLKTTLSSLNSSTGLSNVNNQIKQTASLSSTLKSGLSSLSSTTKSLLGIGTAVALIRKGINFIKEANTEAVDYAETVNLFNVSMGKVKDQYGNLDTEASKYYTKAIAFQEEMNEKLGTNIEETMKYQALFNSLSKSSGIDNESAYTISENMTKLGYDLASLYNIEDIDTAMSKLQSALSGQTKPLRELGVDITENTLTYDLEILGIDKSISDMNQAEKVILRYLSILRQTTSAQGDYAKTVNSTANQLKIFENQITTLKRNIGNLWQSFLNGILPYINAVIMVVNELLKLMAELFGWEVWEQDSISASVGVGDLADDLDTATESAKQLKAQLMGFDEINNITTETSSGSSTSGGSSGTGIDQQLLDALDGYDNLMDSISNKATEIRDKILDWLGVTDGTYTNLKRIGEVVKTIGVALASWKIASGVLNFLQKLGLLKNVNAFQMAFGITLTATGIYAQWKGTRRLLDGDISIFSLLETFLGTGAGTFGIVNILRSITNGSGEKIFSLGNSIKIGLGIMLAIQGFEVLLDGINTGDIKKIILGAVELTGALGLALNGVFGTKLLSGIKSAISQVKSFSTAIGLSTTAVGKHALATTGVTTSLGTFVKKAGLAVVGLAGITGGSALSYSAMKNLKEGTAGTAETLLKLTSGLGLATASGALAGSQFGTLGTIIGGVAGFTTAGISAFLGYKNAIEGNEIPTTTLTDEIEEMTQKIEDNQEAYKSSIETIQQSYDSKLVDAEYSQILANQLNDLVDANGKVKAGYEDRVSYILGELNSALGTEYELNGNLITENGKVVSSYESLQESITNTIAKFKEEAEQEAYQELYKESIKEGIRLKQEQQEVSKKTAEAEEEYNNLMDKNYSWFTLKFNKNCQEIIKNYEDTQNASAEMSKAVGENALEQSQYYGKLVESTVKDTENLTNKLNEESNKVVDNTEKALNTTQQKIDENAPQIESKFEDMAKDATYSYKEGISSLDSDTDNEIKDMMNAIRNNQSAANQTARNLAGEVNSGVNTINTIEAGKQAVEGVAKGINDNKNSWSLLSAITGVVDNVKGWFKEKLGIASPSKVMAELSGYIPEGIAKGIDDNSNTVIEPIKNIANGITNAFEDNITIPNVISDITDGIKINPSDYQIDTNQFIDYGAISGAIATQSSVKVDSDIETRIENAIARGLSNATIPIEIEATTDEGVIFKKVQVKAKEFVMQTGENPFPSLA